MNKIVPVKCGMCHKKLKLNESYTIHLFDKHNIPLSHARLCADVYERRMSKHIIPFKGL